jgi:hypothetical protein
MDGGQLAQNILLCTGNAASSRSSLKPRKP